MLDYVIEYDVCAAITLAVIMLLFYTEQHLQDEQSHSFSLLLHACFVACTLDVLGVALGREPAQFSLPLLWTANLTFLCSCQLVVLLALFYIVNLGGQSLRGSWRRSWFLLLPCLLALALVLSSPLTHWVFYFDLQHRYVFGPYHSAIYVSAFFYMLACLWYILAHRNNFSPRRLLAVLTALLLTVLSMLYQALNPEYLITYASTSVSLLVAFSVLQAPSNHIDRITGLYNRLALSRMMQDRYRSRRGESGFALAVWALDSFGKVNAAVGVRAGDELLTRVGRFLSAAYPGEMVARYGGDRLAVLFYRHQPSRESILADFRAFPRDWNAGGELVSLSATRVFFRGQDYTSVEEILEVVDYSLFLNKSQGPGCISAPAADFRNEFHRHMQTEQALQTALEQGRVEVWYQPLVELSTGRIYGAEALSRLNDPQLGPISPDIFVPLAERLGLVPQLDDHVLRRVCALLRDWDLPGAGVEHISINLSVQECLKGDLYQRISPVAREYGVEPGQLCLEVTESEAVTSLEVMGQEMALLINRGFCFHLDDYGSGFSNLAALFNLPFSAVKLDRSLLTGSELVRTMVFDQLVDLFHTAGFKVVCEGVETPEQDELARRTGVDLGQGYFYSRPLPEAEFLARVQATRRPGQERSDSLC